MPEACPTKTAGFAGGKWFHGLQVEEFSAVAGTVGFDDFLHLGADRPEAYRTKTAGGEWSHLASRRRDSLVAITPG
jgi:hypothetical protein